MAVSSLSGKLHKRRHIRFKPDPLTVAYISYDASIPAADFSPDEVALVVEEAPLGGCGVVMLDNEYLILDMKCLIKVGNLAPLLATLVWKKVLEDKIVRIGFKFLE